MAEEARKTEQERKQAAYGFLCGLQTELRIPHGEVESWLSKRVASLEEGKHIFYEGEFVEDYVLPRVSKHLQRALTLTKEEATEALLAESEKAKKEGIASKSAAGATKHIFSKRIGASMERMKKLWWPSEEAGKDPASRSYPDWAFQHPCPHKVVFEAKLFRHGGPEQAKSEIVNGIYECFYYRAHPQTVDWPYDYACLFAYDLSKEGALATACKTLNESVKRSCWDSSNIFLMVLRDGKAFGHVKADRENAGATN